MYGVYVCTGYKWYTIYSKMIIFIINESILSINQFSKKLDVKQLCVTKTIW